MISPKSAINIIKQYKRKPPINGSEGTPPPSILAKPNANQTTKIITGEKRIAAGVKKTAKPRAKGVKNATSQHISGINAGTIITIAIMAKSVFGSPPLTIGNKCSAF